MPKLLCIGCLYETTLLLIKMPCSGNDQEQKKMPSVPKDTFADKQSRPGFSDEKEDGFAHPCICILGKVI
jgi:hypothetical protein